MPSRIPDPGTRILFLLWVLAPGTALATHPHERWVVDAFSQPLGGGPDTGPVSASGGSSFVLCGDRKGNRYIAGDHYVDIVLPNGLRRHLAGSGRPGYHEGIGPDAEFRLGYGGHLGAYDMACGEDVVFLFDNGNDRIRRLWHTDRGWRTETWVGGGGQHLRLGESTDPRQFDLPTAVGIALDRDGQLWIGSYQGVYRVSADGRRIDYVAHWPSSTVRKREGYPNLNIIRGGLDSRGRVHFLSRSPDLVLRVDKDHTVHVAGRVAHTRKLHELGDGPVRQAYFDTPSGLAMDPATPVAYLSGGDEYNIRRVPLLAEDDWTATLMRNGRWDHARIHPVRLKGPAVFEPGTSGRLRPEGGLTVLMNCHLLGNDAEGALYGRLYPWRGMTQYHLDQGLLPTRLFRLRRLPVSAAEP